MTDKLSPQDRRTLEECVKARPGATREPGYFENGTFVRGPFYVARLGSKQVFFPHGAHNATQGVYFTREAAVEGAKRFRAKAMEVLENDGK